MTQTIELAAVATIPNYAVIIRSIHERGDTQAEALDELGRRGLWLTDEQKAQAGLPVPKAAPSRPTDDELHSLLIQAYSHLHQFTPTAGKDAQATTALKNRLRDAWQGLKPAQG